jgi:hypothetical protein
LASLALLLLQEEKRKRMTIQSPKVLTITTIPTQQIKKKREGDRKKLKR